MTPNSVTDPDLETEQGFPFRATLYKVVVYYCEKTILYSEVLMFIVSCETI